MRMLDESQQTREISNSASLNDMVKKAKENKFKRAESNCEVCGWAREKKIMMDETLNFRRTCRQDLGAEQSDPRYQRSDIARVMVFFELCD